MTREPANQLACGLAPEAMADRARAWRALTERALAQTIEPDHVTTTFPAQPDVAEALSDLVAAERECCSFLEFDVHEDGETIRVEMRYPPEFAKTLAEVVDTESPPRASG